MNTNTKPNEFRMRRKPGKPNNNHRRSGGSNNSGNNGGGRFRSDNNGAKIKSVSANRDKYLNLARDAMASGDRVEAENFLQHAEHYYRVLYVLQEEDARYRAERQQEQHSHAADDDMQDGGAEFDHQDEATASRPSSSRPSSSRVREERPLEQDAAEVSGNQSEERSDSRARTAEMAEAC